MYIYMYIYIYICIYIYDIYIYHLQRLIIHNILKNANSFLIASFYFKFKGHRSLPLHGSI